MSEPDIAPASPPPTSLPGDDPRSRVAGSGPAACGEPTLDLTVGLDELIPRLYDELRAIAHRHLVARAGGGTLSTTALVHEAYLKLTDRSAVDWHGRGHFLAVATLAMRHVLVDRAKARGTLKRGGARRRVSLEDGHIPVDDQPDALLQLDDALRRLAELEPRLARVVEYRFFGGLTEQEIADVLGVTIRTVQRDWAKARMLLQHALQA